ncbi:CinA family protein [Hirschia baltica]|uniref:CinA domain protein n=1 Tax=Hirschia baltica (strain ATCC 49814 / DSM 5838 / IFAM 1418) TaxID=582402 RepID=C6XJQ9_HIRBI|nr:CinA family protein [Hirschia baltica]ACT59354.1 CinA domain protein [Hirschia baltica ATCC 49814]
MFDNQLIEEARKFLRAAQTQKLTLATAESCTGGLLAGLITEIPGSSQTLERGFVVYTNRAKQDMLGVSGDILADFGAVSEPTAIAMAEGAMEHSRASLTVAITGIAGPGGQTPMKPVGLVHIAAKRRDRETLHEACHFGDIGRSNVRRKSMEVALELLMRLAQ